MFGAAAMLIGRWMAPANAADLGEDCCDDLEERIAKIEATTARKGNRTGLFVLASYGEQIDNTRAQYARKPNLVDMTDTTWFVQAGVEYKWNSLGKTNFFGEYRHDDPGSNVSAPVVLRTQSADVDFWTAGVIQHIESAD